MTPAERIARTLAQPLFVTRRGEALTRPQFLRRAVKPKPVTLTKPLPERRAT
jgi:hypothetical protein